MQNNDIQKVIEDVVRKMRYAVSNSLFDEEDLRQELWVKYLEVKNKYNNKYNSRKVLFTILMNHARKLINYSKARPDTSVNSNYDEHENPEQIFSSLTVRNFAEEVEAKEFIQKLKEALQETKISYKDFIDKYFSISSIEKWEELKNNTPMYRQYDIMPLITFFTVTYGVSKTRAVRMIEKVRSIAVNML